MRNVFLLITIFVCSSCIAQDPYVKLNGERFTVELAETSDKQALGLMFRESMPDDHGMLFLFPREAKRSFWMKNTRIPLDILYFDSDLALVSLWQNVRPCAADPCPSYPSRAPARYVLELNAGMAASLGVERGDQLELLFDP